jgi:alkylation response protein AidB-like acyl-CoA dehydrogenase
MSPEASEMLEMLLDSADAFLEEEHDLDRLRIGRQISSVVDRDIWRKMAELGWLGMTLPEPMGGLDLPLECAASLCEKFGRALLPEPYISSGIMPATLLANCPPGEARDKLASEMVSGNAILSIAWQEWAGTIAPDRIDAELSEGLLKGDKLFVPLSLDGTTLLVLAQELGEPVIVTVAADADGIERSFHRLGDGSRCADIQFRGVQIQGEPLVRGEQAIASLTAAIDAGTVALAAQLTGLAKGALELSLDYLRTRNQFGKPIGAFQALQHDAVDLYLLVELAGSSWRRAVRQSDEAPGTADCRAMISAAKTAGNRAAQAAGRKGVQFYGAMGFTDEADIALYLRASLQLAGFLGTEMMHNRRFYSTTCMGAAAWATMS